MKSTLKNSDLQTPESLINLKNAEAEGKIPRNMGYKFRSKMENTYNDEEISKLESLPPIRIF